ncbi:MAG TPA: helix-turn-helix transcriptional regulator [Jiangellaceae bacterium]|nr:helix-turn-helix transcriptional regulator [Jiangellaceae bacterium]
MDERLSDREFLVISLVAEGLTNREIGNRLGFSESTAKCTLVGIMGRFSLRDRAHAVAWAFRNGYLKVGKTPRRTLRPPRVLKPHGTHAATERHRYHNEKPCDVCLEGERHRDRARKRAARKRVAA